MLYGKLLRAHDPGCREIEGTLPLVHGYRRRDGTPVRTHQRAGPSRTTGVVVTVTVAGLAISSSGVSTAEGVSGTEVKVQMGNAEVTLSPDDVEARFVRAAGRIARSGYSWKNLTIETNKNCAEHSFGKVQEFFESNPCQWLDRVFVVVHKRGSKGSVLIDFVWVEMSTAAQADECQRLMETRGAGSVTKLSQEGDSPYKKFHIPYDFYFPIYSGTGTGSIQIQPFTPLQSGEIGAIIDDSLQALNSPA